MKITKHTPPPSPPVTYDLLGLTEKEMQALRNLVGNSFDDDGQDLWEVFIALKDLPEFRKNTRPAS